MKYIKIFKNFITKNNKFFIIFLCFFSFLLGSHFLSNKIWPFGQGYYATFKNIKKYGFDYKKPITEKKAEQIKTEKRKNTYRTTAHLISVKQIPDFFFDHIAIYKETETDLEFFSIKGNESTLENLNPLIVYKTKVNLKKGLITENKKILKIENNLRAGGILITSGNRIFISFLSYNSDKEASLKIIELLEDNGTYYTVDLFKTKPIKSADVNNTTIIQAGGRMIQISNNEILIGIGDFGQWAYKKEDDFRNNKFRNISTQLGKAVIINLNTKLTKIYSEGLRNPQGLVKSKNFIIETEHGPEGGDEINFLEEGGNYGWPYETYGAKYQEPFPEATHNTVFGNHHKYIKPIYAYIPSIGIKAIEKLPESQSEFPNWKDNFLVCSGKGIFRTSIIFNPNPRVVFTSKLEDKRTFQLPTKIVPQCRDLQITSNGQIITNAGMLITRKKIISKF